jgi:ENTS family enterobactin (siderophore) exporter
VTEVPTSATPVPNGASASKPGSADPAMRNNPDFLAMLAGQGISSLGDAISFTAVPLLVLLLTGSGLAMGIIGVLQTIPDLLFGVVAGAFADRWNRRRMMVAADLGRAALTALVPIAFALNLPTMVVLLAVVGPIGVLRVFFMAAYTASIPNLVRRRQLGAATAAFEAVFAIGLIVGPAMAGLLSVLIGPAYTLGIDALSFLVSAAALLLVRRPLRTEARSDATERRLVAEIREGIAFIVRHRTLRLAVGLWSMYVIVVAAWPAVVVWYLTIDRGLGADTYGLVVSSYGLGLLAGAALAGRTVGRSLGPPILLGTAIAGTTIASTATQADAPILMGLMFVCGIGELQLVVGYGTLRAAATPDRLLGRIGSTSRTLSTGGQSLGFFLSGLLLDRIGGTATLMGMGLVVVLTAATFALAPSLRHATVDSLAEEVPEGGPDGRESPGDVGG